MSTVRAPFLKWAGGKRRLVPFIARVLGLALPAPDAAVEAGSAVSSWKRLIEPFAGSAALSLALFDAFEAVWLNDVNEDLMNVYRVLQADPEGYILAAKALFHPDTNNAQTYYRWRDEFNRTSSKERRAALFLYLNRHGYNGLCRYNSAGRFNVPFGRYKRPYFPEPELRAAAVAVQRARLTCFDFETVLQDARRGDVVYCDPPYVPLSATASFTDYASGGFDLAQQERLAAAAEAARQRGAVVVISNHDTEWTRALYQAAEIHSLPVHRSISANSQTRGQVPEIVAVYWPDGVAAPLPDKKRSAQQELRMLFENLTQ